MIQRYFLMFFLIISVLNANAKNKPNQLLENIPSEGLSFLFYYDAEQIVEKQYLRNMLSSDMKEIFEISKEALVYTQDLNDYFGLTVKFKLNEGVDFNKVTEIVESSDLKVSSVKGNFIYLKEEGNKTRFGYIMNGNEFLIVKIYFQRELINKNYQKQLQVAIDSYNNKMLGYDEFLEVRDSLLQLDQVNVNHFFEKLIENDKKSLLNHKLIKNPIIIPSEIIQSPFLVYFSDKSTQTLTNIFGYDNGFLNQVFDSKRIELISDLQKFNFNDSSWFGGEFKKDKIELICIMSSKEESNQKGIDLEIVKYMPENASTFIAYGVDLELFRDQIMEHVDYSFDEYISQMKVGMLLLDDDFLKFFESGFMAVEMISEGMGMQPELKYKAAFRMPNKKKGGYLLKLLNELQYVQKIEHDKENYMVTFPGNREEVYLVLEDDVWIFGSEVPSVLRQKNKKVLKQYPDMGKSKISHVTKIQKDFFGRDSEFGEINMRTEIIDKKTAKNTVTIELNKDIL